MGSYPEKVKGESPLVAQGKSGSVSPSKRFVTQVKGLKSTGGHAKRPASKDHKSNLEKSREGKNSAHRGKD